MPLYILHKVEIWKGVTHAWRMDSLTTLKDGATQLLIKYKSGALVTQLLKSSENQGNWKLTRVNSVTGHPSQELQVSSIIFSLALIFSLQPCFCRFWRDSLFAECDFYSQRLQRSVPVCSRCFYSSCVFLRMLKLWLLLYCREHQQSLTYHSSGQTKVLWQHPTIGWKVNNYILHHIYVLVMSI